MLQRRMLWRLPVVLRSGEKKFGEAKASGKIRKKALEILSEAFFLMAVQAVFV